MRFVGVHATPPIANKGVGNVVSNSNAFHNSRTLLACFPNSLTLIDFLTLIFFSYTLQVLFTGLVTGKHLSKHKKKDKKGWEDQVTGS